MVPGLAPAPHVAAPVLHVAAFLPRHGPAPAEHTEGYSR
jgi:hypothetical protein